MNLIALPFVPVVTGIGVGGVLQGIGGNLLVGPDLYPFTAVLPVFGDALFLKEAQEQLVAAHRIHFRVLFETADDHEQILGKRDCSVLVVSEGLTMEKAEVFSLCR